MKNNKNKKQNSSIKYNKSFFLVELKKYENSR